MKTDFTSWFFAKKKRKKIASSFNSLKFLKFSRIPSKIFTMKDTSHSYYEKSLQRFPISNHRTNPSKLRTPSNGVNKKLARPWEGNISKESEFSRGKKKGKTEYTRRPWSKRDDGVEYNTAVMRLSNAIFHSNVRVNALTMHPMHMTAWFSDKRALDGFNASGWKTL